MTKRILLAAFCIFLAITVNSQNIGDAFKGILPVTDPSMKISLNGTWALKVVEGITDDISVPAEDPSWGSGGGDILVGPTKADGDVRTLVVRSLKALRQYDSWFAGASEFWLKTGSIEKFKATSEADIRQYDPTVTDFMIVVRRNQLEQEVPLNAVLVSEWTPQLSASAFMMVEDDGGTRTTWKASTTVKYNSKSYGIELEIPLNSRDDIVWRGSLSYGFIEKNNGLPIRLGDVELVLELI